MSGERTGHGVLLKVNTGTVGVPVWTEIGSQRDMSIENTTDIIDVSSKESNNDETLPGRRRWAISGDALYIKDTADFNKLRSAFEADTDANRKIQVMEVHDATNVRWIYAWIESMTETFPDNAEATISISLRATGDWTQV